VSNAPLILFEFKFITSSPPHGFHIRFMGLVKEKMEGTLTYGRIAFHINNCYIRVYLQFATLVLNIPIHCQLAFSSLIYVIHGLK